MGKRTWLENSIQTRYIPTLSQLQGNAKGQAAAQILLEEIRQQWSERGFGTLKQQQSLMDQTRRTIKDTLGEDHWSLDIIRFTTEEYTQINDEKQGRVSQRNENVQFLENPDAIVAQAVRLLESPEWAEVAAGLSVLTGRRSSEILSTAHFEPKTQWSVIFTGALKRRGETQTLSFEIPTLTTAKRVCNALVKVRRELPDSQKLPAQQVNSRYGAAVARACDAHFADLVPMREGKDNLYTHLFRSVYATIATFWYCPPQVNETEFKAHIQGHFAILDENNPELRRNLAASRHYSNYEIADKVIAQHSGKRKGIKLGVGGVEVIEVFKLDEVIELLDELPTQPRRKRTTSIRLWQDDKTQLNQIFRQLKLDEELSQQGKMAHLLGWVRDHLEATLSLSQTTETVLEQEQKEISQKESDLPLEEDKQLKSVLLVQQTEDAQTQTRSQAPEEVALSGLEAKIDRLVDVMTQFIHIQMQSHSVSQPVIPQPVVSRTIQAPKQEGNNKAAGEQAERRRRRSSETDEIIHQAINAIMQHNDQTTRHDDKWAITINALKAFAKSQRKIEMILQNRREDIKSHHALHQITPERHNLKHRGKHKIEEIIRL